MPEIEYPAQLFWGNEIEGYRRLTICDNLDELMESASGLLLSHLPCFISPYYRIWTGSSGELMIDYGSHSHFFKAITIK